MTNRIVIIALFLSAATLRAANLPSIAPTFNVAVDNSPLSIVAADFDGDGNLDLAVGLANNAGIRVFSGDGQGTFRETGSYLIGEPGLALASADLDGDGHPDLQVVIPSIPTDRSVVAILLNDGHGHFAVGQRVSLPASPFDVTVGDFNRDHRPDLAVALADSGIAILLGNGDGTLTNDPLLRISSAPAAFLATGDLNRDGIVDLVYAYGFKGIGMLPGHGDGTFGTPVISLIPSGGEQPLQLAVADVNGDGVPDVVAGSGNYVHGYVFINNGDGTFVTTFVQTGRTDASGAPRHLALADFDNDGRIDIATVNGLRGQQNSYSLVLSTGGGSFAAPRIAPAGGLRSEAIIAADFNHDGAPDLAIATTDRQVVEIHLSVLVPPARRRTIGHR